MSISMGYSVSSTSIYRSTVINFANRPTIVVIHRTICHLMRQFNQINRLTNACRWAHHSKPLCKQKSMRSIHYRHHFIRRVISTQIWARRPLSQQIHRIVRSSKRHQPISKYQLQRQSNRQKNVPKTSSAFYAPKNMPHWVNWKSTFKIKCRNRTCALFVVCRMSIITCCVVISKIIAI